MKYFIGFFVLSFMLAVILPVHGYKQPASIFNALALLTLVAMNFSAIASEFKVFIKFKRS